MWRRCTCTFQGYVILHLNFLFRRIVFLVCGVAGPHEQIFPMDFCIAICKKYGLSAPEGYPHVGQGEERSSHFDVTTDILVVCSSMDFCCSLSRDRPKMKSIYFWVNPDPDTRTRCSGTRLPETLTPCPARSRPGKNYQPIATPTCQYNTLVVRIY